MPWAGHLIRAGGAPTLSCRHAIETITAPGADARSGDRADAADPSGGFVMSDLAFVGLTVAFFALCIAYTWFCEKLR
jgi:hypothetical protein